MLYFGQCQSQDAIFGDGCDLGNINRARKPENSLEKHRTVIAAQGAGALYGKYTVFDFDFY